MSKTRIFLSSTCYDLAAVREALRDHILQLGHEPVLSEYPSFPVNPEATAIENCKTNVERNCDILILIVGGRRGALDPESGRSVTNAEYDRAWERGIPCFVFVNRSVSTLYRVWEKNPTADFSPDVDFPEVFEFIRRIQEENRWTFTFERTAEIKEVLTIQLSTMLRELIERSRGNTLAPYSDFAGESREAQRLAREKPDYWEFLLTAELLKSRLAEVRKRFKRQQDGSLPIPSYIMTGREFLKWVPMKMHDLSSLAQALEGQLPSIQEAWGPLGKPGNPSEIKKSVDQLAAYCDQLLHWEQDLCAARPPDAADGVKNSMKGWTEVILKKLDQLPEELLRPFQGNSKSKGEIRIMLTLTAPSFEKFYEEFELLKTRKTAEWIDD